MNPLSNDEREALAFLQGHSDQEFKPGELSSALGGAWTARKASSVLLALLEVKKVTRNSGKYRASREARHSSVSKTQKGDSKPRPRPFSLRVEGAECIVISEYHPDVPKACREIGGEYRDGAWHFPFSPDIQEKVTTLFAGTFGHPADSFGDVQLCGSDPQFVATLPVDRNGVLYCLGFSVGVTKDGFSDWLELKGVSLSLARQMQQAWPDSVRIVPDGRKDVRDQAMTVISQALADTSIPAGDAVEARSVVELIESVRTNINAEFDRLVAALAARNM